MISYSNVYSSSLRSACIQNTKGISIPSAHRLCITRGQLYWTINCLSCASYLRRGINSLADSYATCGCRMLTFCVNIVIPVMYQPPRRLRPPVHVRWSMRRVISSTMSSLSVFMFDHQIHYQQSVVKVGRNGAKLSSYSPSKIARDRFIGPSLLLIINCSAVYYIAA